MKSLTKTKNNIAAALFLMSASGIAMEVALTRLFSFLYTNSYVYLIISISMAGLGLGAVLMSILPITSRKKLLKWIIPIPVMLLFLMLIAHLLHGIIFLSLASAFCIYLCIGMFQILIFQQFNITAGKLYSADLSGAATGSIAVFFLLNYTGALITAIIIASAISICFIFIYIIAFKNTKQIIIQSAAASIMITALFLVGINSPLLPKQSLMKEMTIMLNDYSNPARIVETRWSAFGRVDVVETENPLFKTLFIDGAAGTKMIAMEGKTVSEPIKDTLLFNYIGGIPLTAINEDTKNSALIIGSGGGIDVVTVELAGYTDIDAVEINPDFIEITLDYSSYNGGIYSNNDQVNLFEGEGRSFIRKTEKKYNLIHMSLPIIKSARNFGNQALTENYLFTREAFGEYFEKLDTDGILMVVAHYPNELMKLAVNAASAMEKKGMPPEQIMERIVTMGKDNAPVILIKKSSFTIEETQKLYTVLADYKLRGSTNFIPGFSQRTKSTTNSDGENIIIHEFNPGLHNYSIGEWDLKKINEINIENIGIVSDNSPFFYQMSKKLPLEIKSVAIISALLILGCIALFLKRGNDDSTGIGKKHNLIFLFIFIAIGIGYMLIEISYLQKFIFYWQHQTLALAVVLSIILIFSGAGSFFSSRLLIRKNIRLSCALLIAVLILNAILINRVITLTAGEAAPVKFLVTLLITGPPFFLMGLPFPIMLETNSKLNHSKIYFPWMIGVNSLSSLFGGVFSMTMAIKSGYNFVLAAGIFCYVLALLLITLEKSKHKKKSAATFLFLHFLFNIHLTNGDTIFQNIKTPTRKLK